MTSIDPHIFRAYDVRGKVGSQLTEDACRSIGRGFGSTLREMYGIEHPTVAVGRDARTHSPGFHEAVIDGLRSTGCNILDIGITPSPVNYFTICTRHLDGSIQVTASHNGPEDNGLKLQIRDAEAFAGDDLQTLRARIEREDFLSGEGDLDSADAISPYLDRLEEMFDGVGRGLRVAVDCGNGVAGPTYTEALRRVGAEVHGLYIEPDGSFPHHLADPSKWDTLKDLQHLVNTKSIHLGFAFDGDGDRVGLVDETGTVRTADDILLLLARDHLSRHPKAPVIFTVSN